MATLAKAGVSCSVIHAVACEICTWRLADSYRKDVLIDSGRWESKIHHEHILHVS